ncbi:butyrophilin-like protein 2 isoform X2 [Oreochromis niloticus]|uniref:butyrophilin-like protein 2 isoform X2 n=1 Tax=Oreochromis niloticus TaxID=8128 RepID=UPI000904BC41|nr:butyrophilin-like protein 2 isoform X2 [Oreochromis niloticus]CAI5656998.1 unnamed protein product [Mustela putorius furo]
MKMFAVFVILLQVSQGAAVLEVYEEVEAVVLACQYFGIIPEDDPTVIWSRFDLNPKTVHRRRDEDDLQGQNQHYSGRTSMRPDALDTGDYSLTLRKLQLTDSGNYTCTISDGTQNLTLNNIQLQVKERFPAWSKVLLVLLVLTTVIVSGGLLFYFRLYLMSVHQVEVDAEMDAVQLPCKTITHLAEDAKVEWSNSKGKTVHLFENSSNQHEEQHWFYRQRTEMKKRPLKAGDLSLTLKYPTDSDTDTYTCTARRREGNILMKKQVQLHVKVCQVEVKDGEESIQLPFKSTGDLPDDIRVKWWRDDPEPMMMVHVYQNKSDQPDKQDEEYRGRTETSKKLLETGNLSLTLKHPTVRDTGRYRCRVDSRNIWREKNVLLKVGASEPLIHPAGLEKHLWMSEEEMALQSHPAD